MKRLCVLKFGTGLESLKHERGDFEDWLQTALPSQAKPSIVVDLRAGHSDFPELERVSGVMLTGSDSMVTERDPWYDAAVQWLPSVIQRGIPILGICYGHQLLAQLVGGEIAPNPAGPVMGTRKLVLTEDARYDSLFSSLDSPASVQVSHSQFVKRLPDGAKRLGSVDHDLNHAFAIGSNIWGTQFHPEFDAFILRSYVSARADILTAAGHNPGAILNACYDSNHGKSVLARFYDLVCEQFPSL